MIKIIIADDHQIVIDGLKSLLKDEDGIKIIGEALNGKQLIEKCSELGPDLVLTDIGMPVMDGHEACNIIIKNHSNIKTLVLTTYADSRSIRKMLKTGVDGYLLKDSGKSTFIQAIQSIMSGEKYYDQRVTEVVMNSFSSSSKTDLGTTPLTEREKDIIRLIADGLNTRQISESLFLSQLTIETHRKNIYTKLGINNIASLVRYALEEGIVR